MPAALFVNLGRTPYQGIEFADMAVELVEINCDTGLLSTGAVRVTATIALDLGTDGRIVTIHNATAPDKLHAVADGITHDLGGARSWIPSTRPTRRIARI